jgi:hypothetical protein
LAASEVSHAVAEVWHRDGLASVYARTGRSADAQREAARTHEIVGDGDGWRGIRCLVAHAEGMSAAANSDFDEADRAFEESRAVAHAFTFVWGETNALYDWAFARELAGDAKGANAKLDELAELYRRLGMGQWWFDRLEAERP